MGKLVVLSNYQPINSPSVFILGKQLSLLSLNKMHSLMKWPNELECLVSIQWIILDLSVSEYCYFQNNQIFIV